MEKPKKWHLFLILAVITVTLYNILPTVLYYTQPLKEPISENQAVEVSKQIAKRIEKSEQEAIDWVKAYAKHLGVNVRAIRSVPGAERLIEVQVASDKEAETLRNFLPYAAANNTRLETKVSLLPPSPDQPLSTLLLARAIPLRITPEETKNFFTYIPKFNEDGTIAKNYFKVIAARADRVQKELKTPSAHLEKLKRFSTLSTPEKKEAAELFAKEIVALKPMTADPKLFVFLLRAHLPSMEEGGLDSAKKILEEAISLDEGQEKASTLLKDAQGLLATVSSPLGANENPFRSFIDDFRPDISLYKHPLSHPLFSEIHLDVLNEKITLIPKEVVKAYLSTALESEKKNSVKEALYHRISQEMGKIALITGEEFQESVNGFSATVSPLTDPQSMLCLNLDLLGKKLTNSVEAEFQQRWTPLSEDLGKEHYPLLNYSTYSSLPEEEQQFGLVFIDPKDQETLSSSSFSKDTLYIVAKGLKIIRAKYDNNPGAIGKAEFEKDLKNLGFILGSYGFTPVDPQEEKYPESYSQDIVFTLKNFYRPFIATTKEQFVKLPNISCAYLYFTNLEQRILADNHRENEEHEELLRARDEYNRAIVSEDKVARLLAAPPSKSVYLNNLLLSARKYLRGDENKVLKWGLDLSGGKSVRIGLEDHNKNPVTDQESLEQAVSELYQRINKMGVSEQTIRIENEHIVVDFPGSQEISAQDLIKASSMHFSIVNEKFSPLNPDLNDDVQKFLLSVWEEATLSGKTDSASVNEIAWKKLGGDLATGKILPKSNVATTLYEAGLTLANPRTSDKSAHFDDTLSTIGILKGDSPADWLGQNHPLIVLFNNYALEGASLTDIRVGYDPKEGNMLSFHVKSSYEKQAGSPQDDFYAWTRHFSSDQIQGTEKAQFSRGHGWRMAVVLNDQIISTPRLQAALRDGGVISGKFTQREVDKLAADLKAGSLSFTPKILSEYNVSPELGLEERTAGIQASAVALLAVAALMIGVYRFWGVVAMAAVLFNILIMWGVLQNFGAAITLPGIAGIVLTIGMAVDANVLVFERFKEEFLLSGKLFSSMKAAYAKAFSAIADSNITTIIAALILLQFDSGPIKGFAVTLIIGIVSSMFTALFMTKYFFSVYLKDRKEEKLNMVNLFSDSHFNFLKYAKLAAVLTLFVVVSGGVLFFKQTHTIFGMDFTGGYSLTLTVDEQPGLSSYISKVEEALLASGAHANDIDIRQLNRPEQLKIFLSTAMEEPGRPFYHLPEKNKESVLNYKYQQNPRLAWVIGALEKGGITISSEEKSELQDNWSVMSGQFSHVMRNNALLALTFALVSILIYITIRFEFNYALAAVLALAHDVLVTLSLVAFFHWIGFPVQINLEIIGAIMTIIGYALNDTIIIFDRIREDLYLHKKWSLPKLMNHALNVTLSRTLMTSGTTLAVLFTLVLMGGKSIFGFSFVMMIGVLVGTLSSLFVAAPLLLFLQTGSLQGDSKRNGAANTPIQMNG